MHQHPLWLQGNPCIPRAYKALWRPDSCITPEDQTPPSHPRCQPSSSVSRGSDAELEKLKATLCPGNLLFSVLSPDFSAALLLLLATCPVWQPGHAAPAAGKGQVTDSCVFYARTLLQNITRTLTLVRLGNPTSAASLLCLYEPVKPPLPSSSD